METDRLNGPETWTISLEVLGHELQFSQEINCGTVKLLERVVYTLMNSHDIYMTADPNSKHHGTTVWDASMVFAKFLEKNCRKGRFCHSKLKGKRVIELGAGCGVSGFGMALLGCHVVATDQADVVPLLTRNMERNTSRIIQMNPESGSFGSVQVAELDWGNEDHIRAVGPPFDYIIGTDVVYSEQLLEPLLKTILALSGPKTTIMMGYEIRSTNVHEQMLGIWKRHFEVKTVPKAKMDSKYQHHSIQIYIMGLKPSAASTGNTTDMNQPTYKVDTDREDNDDSECSKQVDNTVGELVKEDTILNSTVDNSVRELIKEDLIVEDTPETGKLSEWEARRHGSMAARLLRDVKITLN